MTILNISESARLAGISRNSIYEKINAGELSRTSDGIDTSELARVFPHLRSIENVRIKTIKKQTIKTAHESRDATSEQLTEHLEEQVVWLREMLSKRERQLQEKDRQMAEYLDRLQQKDEFWANQVRAVQCLLPSPEDTVRRKKLFGIF